jgi:hypothetical protein
VNAIRVSFYEPSPTGDGGYHRAYQVVHDLAQAVGEGEVIHANVPPPWNPWQRWPGGAGAAQSGPQARFRQAAQRTRRRLSRLARNPYQLAARTHFRTTGYLTPGFLAHYETLVAAARRPLVCVLEHTGLSEVLDINARHGVPTIACPQNLEAFDTALALVPRPWGVNSIAADFAVELEVLARCAERVFISRVEAGLVGGLGLPARYYPYRPVGEIAARLGELRRRRAGAPPAPGLFLMVGSAGHASTRAGFAWFCAHAQRHGLPAGLRVVVAGNQTESLLPPGAVVPGLELRGWIEQAELDALLAQAVGMLCPQPAGFGALTRLPELACAGLPAIVSRHPLNALEAPPGAIPVDDTWDAWLSAMQALAAAPCTVPVAEYNAWHTRQAPALAEALAALAD